MSPLARPALLVSATLLLCQGLGCSRLGLDAGPDQQIRLPALAQLDAEVRGRAPLAFWIADGDGPREDHVVTYDSSVGFGVIGPLADADGQSWGWPGDLLSVGSVIYGVDSFWQRLYTLNRRTGRVKPLGPAAREPGEEEPEMHLGSLAYDPGAALFYAVDWGSPQNDLLSFDPDQLRWQEVIRDLPFENVRGLAWNPQDDLLYLYDAASGEIHSLERETRLSQLVLRPEHAPGDYYDELSFFSGELYATLHIAQGPIDATQLRRIDLATGQVEDVGPQVPTSDGHCLLIESLPEALEWTLDSGPGAVSFGDPADPRTSARFSAPGSYRLRLTLHADPPVSDTLVVRVEGS